MIAEVFKPKSYLIIWAFIAHILFYISLISFFNFHYIDVSTSKYIMTFKESLKATFVSWVIIVSSL